MYLNPEYKYVCFTDDETYLKRRIVGPWHIEPLRYDRLDNTRNNRYHKMHPHELFSDYEESLFIDANIQLRGNCLFAAADAMHGRDVFLAIPPHRRCRCLYDELEECVRSHKDNAEVLEKHRIFLEEEGYPRQMGLTENNVIYRKHKDPRCIKVMSIGFFIRPTDALMWRGGMAVNALHQLIHQTRWGKLDYLLIDLPPGTGDIHLSIIKELSISGAVIVSTPQQIAVADVVRGVEMFRHEAVNIPVLGIVENMAWFTPEELPNNRYYIFGKGGAKRYAEEVGVPLLGEVPIIQSIMEGGDDGRPAGNFDPRVEEYYAEIAAKIVEKLPAEC